MESIEQIKSRADQISRESKKLLAFILMTLVASALATSSRAQTFDEWFHQKSTQKKYLLQQIAALQVYESYLSKGYSTAKGGLGNISGALKSEYNLHTVYYNKLNVVNPLIKNDQQVADILQWQKDIIIKMSELDSQTILIDKDRKYIGQVKSALFIDCNAQITQLQIVLSDNKLKMSDEERLKSIARIHTAMQNNYRFAAAFTGQVKVYGLQQLQEKNGAATSKNLFGLQ
jgi:hypothetical protein